MHKQKDNNIFSNVLQYLKSKNFKPDDRGENLHIDCPFCTDKRQRFGIHKETGAFRCFNCDVRFRGGDVKKALKYLDKNLSKVEKGEIKENKVVKPKKIKINQKLYKEYIKNLSSEKSKVISYLKEERGFSKKTIDFFKLGSLHKKVKTKKGKVVNKEYVAIPYFENGNCTNLKYRAIKFKDKSIKWRRETGGKTSLFNDQVLYDLSYNDIILTESEIDTMSLHNVGVKNAAGLTAGADSFKAEWFDKLQRFDRIYLLLDSDEVGQAAAKSLAHRLGIDRCYNITLPEGFKDPNEYFYDSKKKKLIHDKDDFKRLKRKAKRFEVEGVVSTNDMFDDLKQELHQDDKGLTTPWSAINNKMGKAKPGQLIVIAAKSKCGKSTFALNWQEHLGEQGHGTLFYSCEMNSSMMARNLVRMHDHQYEDIDSIDEDMTKRTKLKLKRYNMQFMYPMMGNFDLDDECQKIENAVRRYGIKVVFFDNLLFLTRGIKGTQSQADKVGLASQRFKHLAEKLGIVFVLLTHPRKVNHNNMIGPDDLKESSSIFQDLDNLIILHRPYIKNVEDNFLTYRELYSIDKKINKIVKGEDAELLEEQGVMSNLTEAMVICRWSEGGKTKLYLNGFRGRFTDNDDLYRALRAKKVIDKTRKGRKKT